MLHLKSFLPLLLSSSAVVVMGAQDSSIWAKGTSNENLLNPQYYREAYNVLRDLSEFDSLYIKFDSCVYSEAGSAGRDDRKYDDYSALQIVGDGANWWYVGNTPFVQANVAFSLYGVLSGKKDKGCSGATFINSFHTYDGINSLLATLEDSGIDFSSMSFPYVNVDENNYKNYDGNGEEGDDDRDVYVKDCVAYYQGNYSALYAYDVEDENENDDRVDFGDDAPTALLATYFESLVSYGLGCKAKKFEFAFFTGGSCDARHVSATLDKMQEINSLFEEQQCLQIYSSNDGVENVGILSYSQACEHNLKYCPDPHDKLRVYSGNMRKSLHTPTSVLTKTVNWIGGIFMAIAVLSFAYAAYMIRSFIQLYVASRKKQKGAEPATEEDNYQRPEIALVEKKSIQSQGETYQNDTLMISRTEDTDEEDDDESDEDTETCPSEAESSKGPIV